MTLDKLTWEIKYKGASSNEVRRRLEVLTTTSVREMTNRPSSERSEAGFHPNAGSDCHSLCSPEPYEQ